MVLRVGGDQSQIYQSNSRKTIRRTMALINKLLLLKVTTSLKFMSLREESTLAEGHCKSESVRLRPTRSVVQTQTIKAPCTGGRAPGALP